MGGKTMVVIGSQPVASEVSRKASAMGIKVIEVTKEFDNEFIDPLLAKADFVITAFDEIPNITLSSIKPNAVLVNLGEIFKPAE